MSKVKQLSTAIDELIEAGKTLTEVGLDLKQYFTATAEQVSETKETKETPAATAEEIATTISFEEVRKILSAKASADNGKYKNELKALVAKYSNTGTLKGVPEDKYQSLIAEAEVIGNV